MADTSHHLQALDTVEEKVIVLQTEATVDPPETAWRIEFLWYIMILYRLRVPYFVSQVNTILCIKWKIHLIRSSNNFYHFSWHSFISFTEGGNDRQLDIDISQVKLGVLFREKKYLLCLSVCPVHRKTLNVIKSCYQVNWLSGSSVVCVTECQTQLCGDIPIRTQFRHLVGGGGGAGRRARGISSKKFPLTLLTGKFESSD